MLHCNISLLHIYSYGQDCECLKRFLSPTYCNIVSIKHTTRFIYHTLDLSIFNFRFSATGDIF